LQTNDTKLAPFFSKLEVAFLLVVHSWNAIDYFHFNRFLVHLVDTPEFQSTCEALFEEQLLVHHLQVILEGISPIPFLSLLHGYSSHNPCKTFATY
jgi:hypothetical protein